VATSDELQYCIQTPNETLASGQIRNNRLAQHVAHMEVNRNFF